MAAPIVSGIAALLVSEKKGQPGWTPDLMTAQILSTGNSINIRTQGQCPIGGTTRVNALQCLTRVPEPNLQYSGRSISDPAPGGNGNGEVNPGETINVIVSLHNAWGNAEGVTARLTSTNSSVSIEKGDSSFGSIGPHATLSNSPDPFRVKFDSSLGHNYKIPFDIEIRAANSANVWRSWFFVTTTRAISVGGTLAADTLWTSGSLYRVSSVITVPAGVTLRIQAGAKLLFNQGTGIGVLGTLETMGTRANPVILTANSSTPFPGYFGFIQSSQDGRIFLRGCDVSYGSGIKGTDEVSDCTFSQMTPPSGGYTYALLYLTKPSSIFQRNVVRDNTSGVYPILAAGFLAGGDNVVRNNLFRRNTTEGWMEILLDKSCTFTENAIVQNDSAPIEIRSVADFSSNIIYGNGTDLRTIAGTATIPLHNCYWDTTSLSDIEGRINDQLDDISLMRLSVQGIASAPPEGAPPILWKAVLDPLSSTQGAGLTTFTLTFSRDMQIQRPLDAYFGPAAPYTQHRINGGWIGPRVWRGDLSDVPFHRRWRSAHLCDQRVGP